VENGSAEDQMMIVAIDFEGMEALGTLVFQRDLVPYFDATQNAGCYFNL
jgi:hypothetical protein